MFNTANLSLDQAPPISVPFRYFLTAPLFGVLAGLLGLWFGPEIFTSRWMPATLSLTHLITLGVLALVMCGAIVQMLPVLAGSPVPKVLQVGRVTHILLVLGTLALSMGFLTGEGGWMSAALVGLGAGFSIFFLAVGIALWRVKMTNNTVTGMRAAVLALLVTLSLGGFLAGGVVGLWQADDLSRWTNIHLTWGMFGWVGLLLISVSYQVVPMFQVTPEYPAWIGRFWTGGIFAGLLIWLFLGVLEISLSLPSWPSQALLLLLGLAYAVFFAVTLILLKRRRRRIMNVTLQFWYTGIFASFLTLLLWVTAQAVPEVALMREYPFLLGILLLLGAGLSFVNGMLYRIVPFLSWFHLQNRQLATMNLAVSIPNMKELLPDRLSRIQFYIHLAALLLALLAVFFPGFAVRPAAFIFVISSLFLLFNLLLAVRRFRQTLEALQGSSS